MNIKIRWAAVGFIVMFIYGVAIFAFGPFSGPYTNPPDQKILTPFSITILGFGTAVVGSLFSLLLFRFYRNKRVFDVYTSVVLIALTLILSIVDGPAQGDTDLLGSLLTYYLPGNLVSIPIRLLVPFILILFPFMYDLIVVIFSWITWGFLGLLVGYLLDRLRAITKK